MKTDLEQFCQDVLKKRSRDFHHLVCPVLENCDSVYIIWSAYNSGLCFIEVNLTDHLSEINELSFYLYNTNIDHGTLGLLMNLINESPFDVRDENVSNYIMFLYEMYPEMFGR